MKAPFQRGLHCIGGNMEDFESFLVFIYVLGLVAITFLIPAEYDPIIQFREWLEDRGKKDE
jgi:hypothetical protein